MPKVTKKKKSARTKKTGTVAAILTSDRFLSELGKPAFEFAKRILGPFAEGADLITDRIKFLRWKAAVRTLKQADEYVREMGLPPKRVPIKTLVPLLEKCSLEEDEGELVKRWAALLANASLNPSLRYNAYINILSNIDHFQAEILEKMFSGANSREVFRPEYAGSDPITVLRDAQGNEMVVTDYMEPSHYQLDGAHIRYEWHEDDIPNTNEFSFENFEDYLQLMHLKSLGLVEMGTGFIKEGADQGREKKSFLLFARLTPLGFDFIKACRPPASED